MAARIIRGQTIRWPIRLWEDVAKTTRKNLTGGTFSIINNTLGAAITITVTDAVQGEARIDIADTSGLKVSNFGSFRIKLLEASGNTIVFPDVPVSVA